MQYRPEDLSALVLRALKADAEHATGEKVEEVIISVPAYFNDQQRKATRLAGELAGLTVLRLVNEPTAAALFHGIHERDADATFLIIDLGGGTFDVSTPVAAVQRRLMTGRGSRALSAGRRGKDMPVRWRE